MGNGKVGKMGKRRGRHARRMRLTALHAALPYAQQQRVLIRLLVRIFCLSLDMLDAWIRLT